MRPWVLALACGLVPLCARAQEQGFVRTRLPGEDLCLHWKVRRLVYNYDQAGSERTPGTAEFVAMDAAFATWRTLARTCSDFVFERGPDVQGEPIGFDPSSDANTNVLVFRETSCRDVVPPNDPCIEEGTCANQYACWDHSDATIALTTTTFSKTTAEIRDADIEFNAAPQLDGYRFLFTTISSPPCEPDAESVLCAATDVQNTLTHEIGHAVGFDHIEVRGSTMEPSAPLGETQKRIIDSGTAAGFCQVYPEGAPAPELCLDFDSLEKKIVAVNRGTPGLDRMGCAAGPGAAFAWAALLVLVRGLSRRRGRS